MPSCTWISHEREICAYEVMETVICDLINNQYIFHITDNSRNNLNTHSMVGLQA